MYIIRILMTYSYVKVQDKHTYMQIYFAHEQNLQVNHRFESWGKNPQPIPAVRLIYHYI